MADCFFTKCFTALQQLWHRFLGEMFSTVVMLEEKASIIFWNNEGSIKCAFVTACKAEALDCFRMKCHVSHFSKQKMAKNKWIYESITYFKKCATNNDLHFRVEFTFFFQVQFYFSLELGRKFNYTRFSWSLFSRVMIMLRTAREVFWKRRRVFNQLSSILFYYIIIIWRFPLQISLVDVACFKRGIQQKSIVKQRFLWIVFWR